MDESAILEKNLHLQVQIVLGFASCDFPVAVQIFPNYTLIHVITYAYSCYYIIPNGMTICEHYTKLVN